MAVGEVSRAIAVAAFVASYVGLALGRVPGFRIDRTGVAIIGAAVMVASGAVPWTDAVASVDAPTLVLLFGMMIVTAYLRLSDFFRLVMTWALRRARTPRMLLGTVVVASGVLSAFFVNDVVCLVLAPVVLEATRQLALPPVPYLIALVTAANVGSVATLTGNPQNMLVGSFSGISYRAFLAREAPIAVIGLVCVFAAIALVYRRQLPNAPLEITPETRLAVHYPLMFKTINATLVMLIAFLAGVPIAIVAIAGAAWTLFTRRVGRRRSTARSAGVSSSLAGLFVVTRSRAFD
jgi:Na+/H+ antiporter NhaD/arsenite permease-like protein